MKISAEKFVWGAVLAGSALLVGGCVADAGGGGYVDAGPDYYGPGYGGAIFYGHPGYHDDHYVARPPARNFAPHPGGGAPHPEAPHPSGGGGGRTTPEPENKRG
jgi:hypothetical protein